MPVLPCLTPKLCMFISLFTLYVQVSVSVPVPAGVKAKMLDVVISKTQLKVAIKGQAAILEVCQWQD